MDSAETSRAVGRSLLADANRLAALASTGLLDSAAEPSFDRLTRLATRLLGTPVALVSLVDANRQFFKSCVGLPEPWASQRETPLSHSFCQHVVSMREPLVIDDARLDFRVKDNLAISDLGVIAYLGIPLAFNGHVIGSFCAIDGKPRAWTSDDIALLRDLADSVVTEIHLRAQRDEIERQRDAADDARLRLNNALSAASIATWTWDIPNDRVVADANLARLFRVSREDAEGGPLLSYLRAIHRDDAERVLRVISEAVADGSAFDEEYRIAEPDGSARWVVARGKVVRDAGGRALKLSGAVVDVTERKRANERLRESEDRYQTLYNSIDAGFFAAKIIYDQHGKPIDYRFLAVNPAFEVQTNWSDVVGKTVREIAPDLESYWFEIFDTIVQTGEPTRFENSVKALEHRFFDVYGYRIGAAHDQTVGILFNDITPRKRADEERERLVGQLRDADLRKDEFLAMLAHELRNPLSAITNASTLLTMTDEPEMTTFCKETIARQSNHLLRLINDLLDVSRVSHGKIDLLTECMDATLAIESAVQTVRPLIKERNHTIDIQLDRGNVWVNADATRLEQIVINLLNNAAKYSANNGHIRLSASHEGDDVAIRIKDAGVGIAPETLPEMFELFAQADRTSARTEGGLGIGLTLVKRLVEMHGGTITADSEGLGKGSEFIVRLPAAQRSPKAPTASNTFLESHFETD
jgi:PAS domain S-box-containing protein